MMIIKQPVSLNILLQGLLYYNVTPNMVHFKVLLNHSIFLLKVYWQKCKGERALRFQCHIYPWQGMLRAGGWDLSEVCPWVISSPLVSSPNNLQEDFHRHWKFTAREHRQCQTDFLISCFFFNELEGNLCTVFFKFWYCSSH